MGATGATLSMNGCHVRRTAVMSDNYGTADLALVEWT